MHSVFVDSIASLVQPAPLPPCALITVVGAGGKTSLVHTLAQAYAQQGVRVLIATSTKTCLETVGSVLLQEQEEHFFDAVVRALEQQNIVTVGAYVDASVSKLVGLSAEKITALKQGLLQKSRMLPCVILCEGDGAARKPLKAPDVHEPVIPHGTDVCLGVMGLDALHAPLEDKYVHRAHLFAKVTGMNQGQSITFKHMLALAHHEQGLFQYCPAQCPRAVFLNKIDFLASHMPLAALCEQIQSAASPFPWWAGRLQGESAPALYSVYP